MILYYCPTCTIHVETEEEMHDHEKRNGNHYMFSIEAGGDDER